MGDSTYLNEYVFFQKYLLMSNVLKNITMAHFDNTIIRSKFRGCLFGALIGDCLGAPYEGEFVTNGEKIIIQRYFEKLEGPKFIGPYRPYTDDTAMTKSVAKFLIQDSAKDFSVLAKLFVNEYFKEPNRGYGQNVIEVFHKLKNSRYVDIYKPSSEQFWGSGSYGNGGAMRIAPVALYFHDDFEKMIEVATNCTKITHTNLLGINGALLQCMAVNQSFKLDMKNVIDPHQFCSELMSKMEVIEKHDENEDSTPYQIKLQAMLGLLKKGDITNEEVVEVLGNGISAYESVPTAIYCFLRAQNEIPQVHTDNVFRRTIQYAVTLGGDTDTIASMAGAIAGAFVGNEGISQSLIDQCEFSKEMIQMAENLFEAREKLKIS